MVVAQLLGRLVTSETTDLQFESSNQQFLFAVDCIEKTNKNKKRQVITCPRPGHITYLIIVFLKRFDIGCPQKIYFYFFPNFQPVSLKLRQRPGQTCSSSNILAFARMKLSYFNRKLSNKNEEVGSNNSNVILV